MSEEGTPAAARHVLFQAGSRCYALPLEVVREVVIPRPPFARVPGAPAAVRGAMNLRGRVVAVVDLAGLLGGGVPSPEQGHVVLLDCGRCGIAILVGPVLGVEPLTAPLPGTPADADPLIRSVTVSERLGRQVTVLDPDALEARAASLFVLQ